MRVLLTTLHTKYIHPSLALPYLAGFCEAADRSLQIREFTLHEPMENILAGIHAEQPDVIGFSVYLWNRIATLQLVDTLHRLAPEIKIFLGGPEISFETEEVFHQHPGLDAIVHGEGEIPVKALLDAWQYGQEADNLPRVSWRYQGQIRRGEECPPLDDLDAIPSPFARGKIDLSRGFVYYETSRGCPYECSFCMSALDRSVRSFSMARIQQDLGLLLAKEVPQIKLVDRTFNYQAERTREIFQFILDHNRSSHLHFEIGAHLLDEPTLELLEQVPAGMFQFEIGVQSTLPETLRHVRRSASIDRLEANIRRLKAIGTIELHLDLIAGLPGEGFDDFMRSIDRTIALQPDHLQIELVKLLPGAPLRQEADSLGIRYSPHPPYTVLATADLSYDQLERIRAMSRLLDLSWNSHRLHPFLHALAEHHGSFATALLNLADWFTEQGLLRHPLSQQSLFNHLGAYLHHQVSPPHQHYLLEKLALDCAQTERIAPQKAPAFFDTRLSPAEQAAVKAEVARRLESIKGQGIKLQFFAAVFSALQPQRSIGLFFYLSGTGRRLEVETLWLTPDQFKNIQ